jgi:hypothetical protein
MGRRTTSVDRHRYLAPAASHKTGHPPNAGATSPWSLPEPFSVRHRSSISGVSPCTPVPQILTRSQPKLSASRTFAPLARRFPLATISGLLAPYLDSDDLASLATFGPAWTEIATYGSIPFPPSARIGIHKRRATGFGKPDIHRSAAHDVLPFAWLCHMLGPGCCPQTVQPSQRSLAIPGGATLSYGYVRPSCPPASSGNHAITQHT